MACPRVHQIPGDVKLRLNYKPRRPTKPGLKTMGILLWNPAVNCG